MITPDLIEYIKSQLNKNISKDLIISRLTDAGWHMEDIEEGLHGLTPASAEVKTPIVNIIDSNNVESVKENNPTVEEHIKLNENPTPIIEVKKTVDPYRELPDGTEPEVVKVETKITPASSLDLLKIWVPSTIKPKNETPVEVKKETEIKAEPEKIKEIEIEYLGGPEKAENSILVQPQVQLTPEIKIQEELKEEIKLQETPKIETHTDIEPYKVEVENEQPIISSNSVVNINKFTLPKVETNQPFRQSALASDTTVGNPSFEVVPQTINKIEEKPASSELIPTINKNPFFKPLSPSVIEPQKITPIKNTVTVNKGGMSDILPRNAMISSYSQYLMSTTKEKEEPEPQVKKHSFLKFIIILFVVSLISGMIFAFVEGYLKIPGSNFSFSVVKKDPKTLLMNAPTSIAKLKSYKVETNINISSPSLSNISIGLSSGKVVNSTDRDSVSINAKGIANHTDGKLLFDYSVDFNSSILKNDIMSNWKFDGTQLFVSVPDLKQIFKKDAPLPTTVSMMPNQLGLIEGEFSPSIQDLIKKIDIYDILSNDVPLYVKNETNSILKEFVSSLDYAEKGEESIHGIETYHYELSADRQSTKKLLSSLMELFIMQLPADQKKNIDEALGSSSFSSFEVWAGKNDNNIYQIKFTLNAPLSKILGLNDSGIAGNEVKLDWTTTYYDIDVENNIVMPEDSISMEGFVKNIKDIKIKNIISAFKPQASSLRNAVGSFGTRSNPGGSCTNPNPSSLFSPQGHTRSAEGAISSISSSMISLLSETNGAGSCYSTPDAWALSAPLATSSDALVPSNSDVNYFYCTDSRGITTTLSSPITGAFCK
jgi:hypothetical protein